MYWRGSWKNFSAGGRNFFSGHPSVHKIFPKSVVPSIKISEFALNLLYNACFCYIYAIYRLKMAYMYYIGAIYAFYIGKCAEGAKIFPPPPPPPLKFFSWPPLPPKKIWPPPLISDPCACMIIIKIFIHACLSMFVVLFVNLPCGLNFHNQSRD